MFAGYVHCYGMTPNLARGKTEFLLALRGPGSKAFKLKYHGPSHGQCMPIVCEHGVHSIAVVQECFCCRAIPFP